MYSLPASALNIEPRSKMVGEGVTTLVFASSISFTIRKLFIAIAVNHHCRAVFSFTTFSRNIKRYYLEK